MPSKDIVEGMPNSVDPDHLWSSLCWFFTILLLSNCQKSLKFTRYCSSVGRVSASYEAAPRSGTFFREFCPSAAASGRASCQLLAKKWVLNTDKLPLGDLPKNSVVK